MGIRNKYYGNFSQTNVFSDIDAIVENIIFSGYHIESGVISADLCSELKKTVYRLNNLQNKKYGKINLIRIGEDNQIRLPLTKSRIFFDEIVMNKFLLKVLDKLFKPTNSFFVLNQQNIIINTPQSQHNQSSWHRDFPYLNGILSIPAAFSAIFCLDNFTTLNGATKVVPFTHNKDIIPSWDYIEKHNINLDAHKGSLIILNSQILHCAGVNKTKKNRIAINNIFTNPIFNQQINIPDAITISKNKWTNKLGKKGKEILGFYSTPPQSDYDFKNRRIKKFNDITK